MIFPPDTSNSTKVYINGVEIQQVAGCRHLGAYLEEELKWTEHIDSVHNKLLKYTGIFYKLLRNIYYALCIHTYFIQLKYMPTHA